MQKLFLIIAAVAISFTANAQSKKLKERTKSKTEFVAEKMNLDKEKKDFLYNAFLANSVEFNKKKKGLPKKERKAVNKEARAALKTKLSEKFSEEEVKQIFALLKERRQLKKQKANSKKQYRC